MKRTIAVTGWGIWDGRGKNPSGGSMVTYELTRRLSKYFNCEMIFESSDKKLIGKRFETGEGLTKSFISRPKGFYRFEEGFLDNYDLFHIWGRGSTFTYRYFTEKLVPHCHTFHSAVSISSWMPIVSAFLIPGYDVVTLASKCLSEVLGKFWEVNSEVIPFGVDVERFKLKDKNECREELGIPKDCIVLGYLGRTSKLDFLLAYDVLRKTKEITGKKDLMLVVAGGVLQTSPVFVTEDFLFLGYLDKSVVSTMLNSCDIFFNPVAGIQEGFGFSVIEAMACGLPIVTTNWNGYRETVLDTGFLARTCLKDGDVWINQDDLVSSCVNLVEDESLREECGRRGRRIVEKQFSWKYCVEKYKELFLNLIQEDSLRFYPFEQASEKTGIVKDKTANSYFKKGIPTSTDEDEDSFEEIYKGFASNNCLNGGNWVKFVCRDNILGLPKYRTCMRETLVKVEDQLRIYFPKLSRLLN